MQFNAIKTQKFYLLVLAFVCGMTIMAVEISASRLIAPYFGTSTFVWADIIGVIMVALAIGYYLGGKLADKRQDLSLLLKINLFACALLLIIPFVTKPIADGVIHNVIYFNSATLFIILGSFILVSVLFLLPILLLGMSSPYIIKLMSNLDTKIGQDAGLVFCVSTIGSIFGTFLPILVFIPYLGTRKTIIIFSLILVFCSLIGLLKKKKQVLIMAALIPLIFLNFPTIKKSQGAIFEDESAYQYFQIVDENNLRQLIINEGMAVFSTKNLNPNEYLTGSYFDYYNIIPLLDGDSTEQNILILGLAGGTISTQLDHYYANLLPLQIDGVEIDSKLISAAQKYFGLNVPSLKVYNIDARNYLQLYDKKYDAIIIDAYASQLYIPFELTSKEFFEITKNHLNEQGIIAMNVNATSEDSPLLKNITNTLNLVFKNVYLVKSDDESFNYLVLASNIELDFTQMAAKNKSPELEPIIQKVAADIKKFAYDPNFSYLTDDKAPIEHLTDWMILDYIFKM